MAKWLAGREAQAGKRFRWPLIEQWTFPLRPHLARDDCDQVRDLCSLAPLEPSRAGEPKPKQGFLTAEYDLPYLRAMNAAAPSIIAVDQSQVVRYALVATQTIRHGHPFIGALFQAIDPIFFRSQTFDKTPYVVVGQLCVGRHHRGQGLVQSLYQHFRESLQSDYHCAVTDIARENVRSLRAHPNTGFRIAHSIVYEGRVWDVVVWDWRSNEGAGESSSAP